MNYDMNLYNTEMYNNNEIRKEKENIFDKTIKMKRENKNEQTINKLLWLDRTAMEEMTACENDCHPPLFVEIDSFVNDFR